MSFGFGVGDIIAVSKFVNRVRKDFVGSPKEFKDISDEWVQLLACLGFVPHWHL